MCDHNDDVAPLNPSYFHVKNSLAVVNKYLHDVEIKQSSIMPGTFIYIKGVADYNSKHIAGNSMGWWCLVVENGIEDMKFMGFGIEGITDLTGITKILVDDYNKEPIVNDPDATSSSFSKASEIEGMDLMSNICILPRDWKLLTKGALYEIRAEYAKEVNADVVPGKKVIPNARQEDKEGIASPDLRRYWVRSEVFKSGKSLLLELGVDVANVRRDRGHVSIEIDFLALPGNRKDLGIVTKKFGLCKEVKGNKSDKINWARGRWPLASVEEIKGYLYITAPEGTFADSDVKLLEKPYTELEGALQDLTRSVAVLQSFARYKLQQQGCAAVGPATAADTTPLVYR